MHLSCEDTRTNGGRWKRQWIVSQLVVYYDEQGVKLMAHGTRDGSFSRRSFLKFAVGATAIVGVPLLAACGGGEQPSPTAASQPAATSAPAPAGTTPQPTTATTAPAAGAATATPAAATNPAATMTPSG